MLQEVVGPLRQELLPAESNRKLLDEALSEGLEESVTAVPRLPLQWVDARQLDLGSSVHAQNSTIY